MKTLRSILLVITVTMGVPALSVAQSTTFMSPDEIRPGMKGIGKTVFQGTAIEEFDVEILGVLKNFSPKQDMILARLSGGPLQQTGVIQGMSGSPVYIEGKLIGAVAFAFPFAKEPIAGIQPIGQMIDLLDVPATGTQAGNASLTFPSVSPAAYVHNMVQHVTQGKPLHEILLPQALLAAPPATAATLTRIQTPLLVSGVTPAALAQYGPVFAAFGFNPVQAGGAGSAPAGTPAAGKLEPGSSVNVEMIRGDISYSANGTVTYVDGDKVYAFGHPNMGAGSTDLPMSSAHVISLLPNVQNSFKLAVPVDVVGAFTQDRSTGVSGTLGGTAQMIPLHLTMRSSTNAVTEYNFELANDRFLTPFLMNFTIFNTITASERALGEMTLSVNGKIHLKDNPSVNIANIFSGDVNGPAITSIAAMAPLQYLMTTGYDGVLIERIELEIVSSERKTSAQLEGIAVDRTEVRPGETVTLTASLRGTNGDVFHERYPVQIPAGLPGGSLQLLVGDGATVTGADLRRTPPTSPQNLGQIIRELNKLRKNDRLYVKLLSDSAGVVIGGEEMPSLPPSMTAVLNSNRSTNRSVSNTRSSTVEEYELPQSQYVIQGQHSLTLTVKP